MAKAGIAGAPRINHTLSATNALKITGLLTLGASITFFHELVKTSYQIPGHRMEWIMLLVIGRLSSNNKWAGTLTGVGAAAATPIFFGLNPAAAATYIAVGVVFDLLFKLAHEPKNVYIIGAISAMAYMTKPILRIPIDMLTGFPYRPLLVGAWFPMLTYCVFGFVGGILGVLAFDINKRVRERFSHKHDSKQENNVTTTRG